MRALTSGSLLQRLPRERQLGSLVLCAIGPLIPVRPGWGERRRFVQTRQPADLWARWIAGSATAGAANPIASADTTMTECAFIFFLPRGVGLAPIRHFDGVF